MRLKTRRISVMLAALFVAVIWLVVNPASYEEIFTPVENTGAENGIRDFDAEAVTVANEGDKLATDILEKLEVKGRAPKTGYSREEFYDGWPIVDGCSLRQRIIRREFGDSAVLDECNVIGGEFDEPYTGEHRVFENKTEIAKIQIDHVVALSDAWQKGAQYKDKETRYKIATDPLNLLAVDGPANEQKSDGDAATWLPKNKRFRCQYVARQVSVKYKYGLWVTEAEKEAILRILEKCPHEPAIGV
ncbi:HNH endonuclease [Candidatus Saccharibacteria bacterium]|nr:HNH endonuclease [Candidatus Saccharibacteria bacterium]